MKKVLSFVLVLALVLSSFSMAFAGSATELKTLSDIDGNKNQEAVEVNYDLGIVTGNPDGTFQPEKAVTRAEFAAMITRALAIPQSALAGYANTNFKDTSGYSWAVPYLAFCNSKGIMLGDGAGNAMPGKTITVNEAVTMSLRAIGYVANSSELVGVWPSNYVTKAQELKMYDDVAKDATGVDKANAAQIIYNTLGVQKVAVNSDGKTEKQWDKEPKSTGVTQAERDGTPTTLLSAGLNCEASIGVVGYDMGIDDALINVAKHIGKYGTVYTNDDDEIVAFISDSDQIVGRFTGNDKFVTTDEEKEYNINVTTIGALMLDNGKTTKNNVAITNALSVGSIGIDKGAVEYALNVDLSGKTVKEIYSAVAWNVNEGDQVEDSDINDIKEDQSLLGSDFVLDDNDEIDYTQFYMTGVKSLSDIKSDNVVYVYADSDGIRRIDVGTQTAEGVVKSFKNVKSDAATKFAIGANTYKNAAEVVNGNSAGGTTVGDGNVSDDVKAFLDARGYVWDFENSTKAGNYAVVERVGASVADQAKLMLADGSEKTFDYNNKPDKAGDLVANTLIGYGLDKNGEITDSNRNYITTTSIMLGSKNLITNVTGATTLTGSNITAVTAGAIAGKTLNVNGVKIDSKCVVFTYNTTKKEYDVTTIDKVEINKTIAGAALLFDENNDGSPKLDKVVAMIVDSTMAKGGDKSYAVFDEKISDANDDGDKVWTVVGFRDGAKMELKTDDGGTGFFTGGFTTPDYSSGLAGMDLYEVKVDANGVMTSAEKVAAGNVGDDVHYINAGVIKSADGKKSVVADNGKSYAMADKVVFYELTDDDEYKASTNSSMKAGYTVRLYETTDTKSENDGYDIVIFTK